MALFHPRSRLRLRQEGFTLIELMVALVISLIVIAAAWAALLSAQRGYAGNDASTQLRSNANFAVNMIQRIALQAGYQDLTTQRITREEAKLTGISKNPKPDIMGYNNAVIGSVTNLPDILSNDSRAAAGCTAPAADTTACANGSDILVIRYYGINDSNPNQTTMGDGSIIDCSGNAVPPLSGNNLENRAYSVFYVDYSSGEPNLMCATNTSGTWTSQPLVEGVESFQVLYGVDNVAPGSPAVIGIATGVPTQWLRADQIGFDQTSYPAWRRVDRVRIGLVLRGPANTAVDNASTAATYYPLGAGSSKNGGSVGMGSDNDAGTKLVVSSADGRLRRTLSFTIDLRNPLNVD